MPRLLARRQAQRGSLLLEALVTMVIVTLGLLTLGQLVAVGAVSAVENRYRQVGTRVAQQFMESAKGMNFSDLKGLTQQAQPVGWNVYVQPATSQILVEQHPPAGSSGWFAFPTGVNYTFQPGPTSTQDQVTVTVDVAYTHRGVTRHVDMTTVVLNNGR